MKQGVPTFLQARAILCVSVALLSVKLWCRRGLCEPARCIMYKMYKMYKSCIRDDHVKVELNIEENDEGITQYSAVEHNAMADVLPQNIVPHNILSLSFCPSDVLFHYRQLR